MGKLNKMLFREVVKSKGQFIAAAAVIFAGITMFAASYMSYLNLKNSLDYYYKQYRFLDYYAEAQSITPEVVKRVKGLDGVSEAIGRISADVGADMGSGRRVTIRLISLPDSEQPAINRLFLISGEYFSTRAQNACLVDRKFAEYYKLKKGDLVKAVINQRIYEFKVDGVVGSPEFIYAMKSADSISASSEDFGIIYVKESTAKSILGYENSYNQLHVTFKPGADEKLLIDRIEKLLRPYGFYNGVERKDQLSHTMINDEIKQLQSMAFMFPALFLSVAAMIIYIMLRRVVSNQRTLIGVMKAFGYTEGRILAHYTAYSMLISLAGAVPGVLTGVFAGSGMASMYTEVYSIPVMDIKVYWDILLIGIGLSMGFCLLAGYNSAKRILAIQPAQAMRPEIPKGGKNVLLERMQPIWRRLPFGWKMSIRNIFRSRSRTLLTLMGTVFTIMFFMISLYFMDCMDYLLKQHFFEFQRQDYKVTFSKPVSFYDALDLGSIKGIKRVEPILELPVEIRKGWMKRDTLMVGIIENNSFYRFKDTARKTVQLPSTGVLIADFIAKKLEIKQGDTVRLKSYMCGEKEKEVRVEGIIKQYIGFNSYMSIDELGSLLGEGKFATGALLKTQRGMDDEIKKELFKIPGIETVEARESAFNTFLQYMDLMYVFIGLMIVFGTIMGFAIVFNTTIINIMERRRELASLKVLGYTKREIENTIFRENVMLGMLALIPGIAFGRFMCDMLARYFSTELFELDVVLYPRTYAITIVSVFIFIILAQFANKKNISGLDMVEVLKNREG